MMDDLKMSTWRNDWTGFFIVYFKWCYYLCVSPFRFEWDQNLSKFRLARNRLQSFACAILYILLGLWYVKDLRKIPVDHLYKDPVVYFTLAFNLNAIYYHICVLAVSLWLRQERFLAIVNFNCEGYSTSNVKHKLVATFLCFLFAILPLLYSFCGYSVISSSRIWDPSLMLRCLVVEGRFAFFLNGTAAKRATDFCSNHVPPDLNEISILDAILGVLAFLMETARQIVGFYSDFFPLVCCLSIWTSIGTLRQFLWIEDQQDPLSTYLDSSTTTATQENFRNDHHHHTSTKQSYNCQLSYYRPRLSLVDDVMQSNKVGKSEKEKCKASCIGGISSLSCINKNPVRAVEDESTSAPVVSEKMAMQQKEQAFMEKNGGGGTGGSREVLGNILLERYEVCKSFSRTVNKALGQLLFAYVLSSIMYLSTCMDAVLVLQDWFGKLRVAFFFFIFILMFFIGSEIVNKVYGVRAWLSDPANNAFLPEKNLLVLIHEVTCKSIGVTGSGMFTITYSTFMTVMTTTVTFFIIILQFQKPKIWDYEELSGTINTLNASLHGLNILIRQISLQIQNGNLNLTTTESI